MTTCRSISRTQLRFVRFRAFRVLREFRPEWDGNGEKSDFPDRKISATSDSGRPGKCPNGSAADRPKISGDASTTTFRSPPFCRPGFGKTFRKIGRPMLFAGWRNRSRFDFCFVLLPYLYEVTLQAWVLLGLSRHVFMSKSNFLLAILF